MNIFRNTFRVANGPSKKLSNDKHRGSLPERSTSQVIRALSTKIRLGCQEQTLQLICLQSATKKKVL